MSASANRVVVLGFRNQDGSLGFAVSTNPVAYVIKNQVGEFTSRAVPQGAALRWLMPQPVRAAAAVLRDQLNQLDPTEAARYASAQSSASAVEIVAELALQELPTYRTEGAIEPEVVQRAWDAIPDLHLPTVPTRPRDEVDLDSPFERLPLGAWPRRARALQSSAGELAADLFIFDLDQTLVNSRALDDHRTLARQTRVWGPVWAAIDQVEPLACWGRFAPHELPGLLREAGYPVWLVSRAPDNYVQRVIERFGIEVDQVVSACGENKCEAFERAVKSTASERPWVFGDDQSDFRAARFIHARSLGNPWVSDATANVAPDIMWLDGEGLLACPQWADLVYLGEHPAPEDAHWHRGSLLQFADDRFALGRYFKARSDRHREPLSTAIIEGKETSRAQRRVLVAMEVALRRLEQHVNVDVVVTVPPHRSKRDRFPGYRARACELLGAADDELVRVSREVPTDYKYRTRAEKRKLQAGRYAGTVELKGQTVLVLDDVITSGSTIDAVAEALLEAGAGRVIGLAWGVTQD